MALVWAEDADELEEEAVVGGAEVEEAEEVVEDEWLDRVISGVAVDAALAVIDVEDEELVDAVLDGCSVLCCCSCELDEVPADLEPAAVAALTALMFCN